MLYHAFNIREGITVETFDSDKHSEEELNVFKSKYTGPKGFCVVTITDIKNR